MMLFLALKTYGDVSNKNNLVCVKITWSRSHIGVSFGGSNLTFGPGQLFIPQLTGLSKGQREYSYFSSYFSSHNQVHFCEL